MDWMCISIILTRKFCCGITQCIFLKSLIIKEVYKVIKLFLDFSFNEKLFCCYIYIPYLCHVFSLFLLQSDHLLLTRSLREPGGPCTKSMEVSESCMERVNTKQYLFSKIWICLILMVSIHSSIYIIMFLITSLLLFFLFHNPSFSGLCFHSLSFQLLVLLILIFLFIYFAYDEHSQHHSVYFL